MVAQIIVLERRPRWAPELNRQIPDGSVVVRACRNTASLRERIEDVRSSGGHCVVVLDPAGWPGECLTTISWLSRLKIRTVIAGYEGIELLEPSLRELGATAVLLPPVTGQKIGATCRRLLEQHSIQSH